MSSRELFPATVYYSGDGYSTAGPKLMGRQAAGQKHLANHGPAATSHLRQSCCALGHWFEKALFSYARKNKTEADLVIVLLHLHLAAQSMRQFLRKPQPQSST